MPDTIETIMTELKQRRDWNNPEEVEIWFEEKLKEVEAKARAEERERIIKVIDSQKNSDSIIDMYADELIDEIEKLTKKD